MGQLYKKLIIPAFVAVGATVIIGASGGPGNNFGNGYTGAPFDAGTCNNCHSGGSFGASVSLQLISGITPVTAYVPNLNYTLRITRTGNPSAFGFQTVAASTSTNAQAGSWGTLPANTQTANISGRSYVEHSTPLNTAITTLDIPWTAPAGGMGNVTFYAALNSVNLSSDPSGDQVVTTSFTVTQVALPVTWTYFRGDARKDGVLLEWAVAGETNKGLFAIQRSADGKEWQTAGTVAALNTSEEHSYSYIDQAPLSETLYRIKQTGIDGTVSYTNTITIKTNDINTSAGLHYLQANDIVVQLNNRNTGKAVMQLYSLSGQKMAEKQVQLNTGTNMLKMEKPQIPGMYIVYVQSEGEMLYKGKVMNP